MLLASERALILILIPVERRPTQRNTQDGTLA